MTKYLHNLSNLGIFGILLTLFTLITPSTYAKVSLLTYNTGLANGYVYYATERSKLMSAELKKVAPSPDLICLQEVWDAKDVKNISKSLKDQYPYQVIPEVKQSYAAKAPACYPSNLFGKGKFITCMQTECKNLKGDDFTACISNKCGDSMKLLVQENRTCAKALFAQVGTNPILSLAKLMNPLFKVGIFTYQGALGTMLLSKVPFEKDSIQIIDMKDLSTTVHRGLLKASIIKDGKKISVSCNHLTANLSLSAPYAGNFSSWEEENLKQVEKMIDLMGLSNKKENEVVVHMGDFNCGFDVPERKISGDFVKSCQTFLDKGFSDPLYQNNPQCTYCLNNTLVKKTKETKSYTLDHTFVAGDVQAKNTVVLDQKVFLPEIKEFHHLSDHFGLMLELE